MWDLKLCHNRHSHTHTHTHTNVSFQSSCWPAGADGSHRWGHQHASGPPGWAERADLYPARPSVTPSWTPWHAGWPPDFGDCVAGKEEGDRFRHETTALTDDCEGVMNMNYWFCDKITKRVITLGMKVFSDCCLFSFSIFISDRILSLEALNFLCCVSICCIWFINWSISLLIRGDSD